MKEQPTTALAVLSPIDIESIPDVGHSSLAPLSAQRDRTMRSMRRCGAAVSASSLAILAGVVLSSPLIVSMSVMGIMGTIAYAGWNILRLVQQNRLRQMYESAYDPRLAVTEGNVRAAAMWWNESFAALREAVADADNETPPKTLASIARGIAELERIRHDIDGRIAALHRRKALPPPPDDP